MSNFSGKSNGWSLVGVALTTYLCVLSGLLMIKFTVFYIASMHSFVCAQAQGSQVTHGPYTDVPKLLISSNCIRLLNVVGQGTINCCLCFISILERTKCIG